MIDVLVVDDDALVGRSLCRQLEREGLRTHLLLEPREAEAVALEWQPRLVVCDLQMPERSGINVLESLRGLQPAMRRCLMSGALDQVEGSQLAFIAPCHVASKPFTAQVVDELVGLVASHIARGP